MREAVNIVIAIDTPPHKRENPLMEFYFDNAATTEISENALKEYERVSKEYMGNPSSNHRLGVKARTLLEEKRESIAKMLGVESPSLIFTSGATESISLFFQTLLWLDKGTVIMSRIEHEAVSSWAKILEKMGWRVLTLPAKGGFVSPDVLQSTLTPDTKAVFVMSVNNVTGAIEPIKELVEVVREYEKETRRKIFFFSDSVQALGKAELNLKDWDVDAASFSAHKINGPRGVGLLYTKNPELIHPLAPAGGQERGHRGGTENTPGIAAFETALREWMANKDENAEKVGKIKEYIEENLTSLGLRIFSPVKSSPYILSLEGPLPSEVFTRMLFDKGFCVSSGSACSNNAKGKSEKILEAMGISNQSALKAIRISLSKDTTLSEAESLVKAFKELIHG